MNYREKIRKAIECPQLGNETYGEFGILNLTQRKYIKRLLDELDNADNFVKKLYFENKQLKKVIDMASARLEYFLIGNLKYQSSQEEFIKLLNILNKFKGDSDE